MTQKINTQQALDQLLAAGGGFSEIELGPGKYDLCADDAAMVTFVGAGADATTIYLVGKHTESAKFSDEPCQTYVFDAWMIYFRTARISAHHPTELVFPDKESMTDTLKSWKHISFDNSKFEFIAQSEELEGGIHQLELLSDKARQWWAKHA